MKKINKVVLIVEILINSFSLTVSASGIKTCEDVIREMVSLENTQSWNEFASCCVEEEKE